MPTAWAICIYENILNILMQRLMLEFWRDICCCQDDDFSQELHVFLQDNARPHSAQVTIVEQLKSCIHQEWAKVPLAKQQKFISSVPKRLQSVIKTKGNVTQW